MEPGAIDQLGGPIPVVMGFVMSGVVAALSIAWLVGYLSRGGFALFGWWRALLAAAMGICIWMGWLSLAQPLTS
jgi:undecaprenyl-diphosphatase